MKSGVKCKRIHPPYAFRPTLHTGIWATQTVGCNYRPRSNSWRDTVKLPRQ